MTAWLSTASLGFSYAKSGREALADISIALDESVRLAAIIGPDGAGKSTLLKLFAGLLPPSSGSLLVGGRKPDVEDEAFVSSYGFMPQTFGLYRELTCLENLRFFAELADHGRKADDAALERVLALTGLAGFESRPAGKLSGGMKQKLALAAALVATPPMLFLDEPTVGVDPLSRAELWRTVEERTAAGERCIFSSASPEEAERADRVILLKDGRVLVDLTPGALCARAEGRTFSIAAGGMPPEVRQRFARRMMRRVLAVEPESPLLDVVPRNGGIDLLTAEPMSAEALERWLRQAEAGMASLPAVRARAAELEDGYAAATMEQAPGSEAAWAARFAATREKIAPTLSEKCLENDADKASPDADDIVIRAKGISRKFGSFVAVADTSFEVRRGEIFGLLGPNGAGKTTTFRMLCGLLPSSSGTTETAGFDLRTAKNAARAQIGYVAQRFSLYEHLTVEVNLKYFGRSYGLWGRELTRRIAEAARSFGLSAHMKTPTGELSEGAKRETAMAAALLHAPKVLFLDEATSGADLAARRAFWRRIATLADSGVTVVVTTHFMEEAEYCDRFLIQDAGKVLVMGSPAQVRERAASLSADGSALTRCEGLPIEEAFIRIVQASRRAAAQAKEAAS